MAEAPGQEPYETLDVRADHIIEFVATLWDDGRSDRENAWTSTIVLPPWTLEDRLRWLDTWPDLGPDEALARLGLSSQEGWHAVVRGV